MVSIQDIKAQLTGLKRYGSGLVGVFGNSATPLYMLENLLTTISWRDQWYWRKYCERVRTPHGQTENLSRRTKSGASGLA
jgi:hypothetical protein